MLFPAREFRQLTNNPPSFTASTPSQPPWGPGVVPCNPAPAVRTHDPLTLPYLPLCLPPPPAPLPALPVARPTLSRHDPCRLSCHSGVPGFAAVPGPLLGFCAPRTPRSTPGPAPAVMSGRFGWNIPFPVLVLAVGHSLPCAPGAQKMLGVWGCGWTGSRGRNIRWLCASRAQS